jgi:hypothetical protein
MQLYVGGGPEEGITAMYTVGVAQVMLNEPDVLTTEYVTGCATIWVNANMRRIIGFFIVA